MKQKVSFRERMLRFMRGRYGIDQLSICLIWTAVIIAVIAVFVRAGVLQIISWGLIVYAYVRIFSKNTSRRYQQNQKFLDATWGIRNGFARVKYCMKYGKQDGKAYHIYSCRKCGQRIRIPKGKGKIRVTCPKCGYQFKKKS